MNRIAQIGYQPTIEDVLCVHRDGEDSTLKFNYSNNSIEWVL